MRPQKRSDHVGKRRGWPRSSAWLSKEFLCRWIREARFRFNFESFDSSKYILRTAYVAGPEDRKMNEDKGLPSRTLRAFRWGRRPDKRMLGSEPGAVTCNSNMTNTYISVHWGYRGWTAKQPLNKWTLYLHPCTLAPSPQASITLGKAEWVVKTPNSVCACIFPSAPSCGLN